MEKKYGNTTNNYTEDNDSVALATTGKEGKNDNKKKDIACCKCRKMAITLTNVTKSR